MMNIYTHRHTFVQLIFIGLMIGPLHAQTDFIRQKYTISFKHESLDTVVEKLQKLVDAGFSYNPIIVLSTPPITQTFNNQNLQVILDSICLHNQLTYQIIGHNIAIARSVKIINRKDSTEQIEVNHININNYYQITGRIVDAGTNNPVSFANVYINNKAIGTLSNNEGYFILKIPLECTSDSLNISCIGYSTVRLLISRLSPDQNLIVLKPSSIYIKEVEVRYVDPMEILQEAIRNIPDNYSKIPLINTAFYREIIRENNYYVNLSEAILSIYKAPYNSYLNNQVVILKGRKSPFVKSMDTIFFKYQGGPSLSLLLDIAKNPGNFLSKEFIDEYKFKLDNIVTIQDRTVYMITFDAKDDSPYALFKGKLYIDRRSLAFVRADFMIGPKGIDQATQLLVQKASRKVKVKLLSAKYLVDYKKQNQKWCLNNIREELTLKIRKKFTLFNKTYYTESELLITKADSIGVHRFNKHEMAKPNDIFVEKIGSYDETFWGEYNIIKPDESIEEELQKVDQKIRALQANR